MVRWSLVAIDGKIILLVQWYRGFIAVNFDSCFSMPQLPVTRQFVGLATELWPIVRDLDAHFGWVTQDTFVDMVVGEVPRV